MKNAEKIAWDQTDLLCLSHSQCDDRRGCLCDKIIQGIAAGQQEGAKWMREEAAKACDRRVMGDNNREDAEAKRCAADVRAIKLPGEEG